MKRSLVLVWSALMLLLTGCSGCNDHERGHSTEGRTTTNVSVTVAPGISAEDFDFDAIADLMGKPEYQNLEALEKKINDPDAKLHRVDFDKDEILDFIAVRGLPNEGEVRKVKFVAYEDADDPDGIDVCFVNITKTVEGGYAVEGGYYSNVQGYDRDTIHITFGPTWGFGSYFWNPYYVPYYHPAAFYYGPSWGYRPSPVHSVSTYRETQRTRNITSVSRRPASPGLKAQQQVAPATASKIQNRSDKAIEKQKSRAQDFERRSGSKTRTPAASNRESTPRPSTPQPSRTSTPSKGSSWKASPSRSGKK